MKTIKFSIMAVLAILLGSNSFAQQKIHTKTDSTKTEIFKVWGNCDMCKMRIEKAAKMKGVSKTDWNKNTKMLTLVYNPGLIKSDAVQKKIAAVGHDTGKYKANDKAYNNLPSCCQYERNK